MRLVYFILVLILLIKLEKMQSIKQDHSRLNFLQAILSRNWTFLIFLTFNFQFRSKEKTKAPFSYEVPDKIKTDYSIKINQQQRCIRDIELGIYSFLKRILEETRTRVSVDLQDMHRNHDHESEYSSVDQDTPWYLLFHIIGESKDVVNAKDKHRVLV